MKKEMLFMVVTVVVSACNATNKERHAIWITGTYTRFSEHEFGREWDTLNVRVQNSQAGEYKIERRWRYERILDGKVVEPEYKTTARTAVYDPERRLLRERKTGSEYTLDGNGKVLFAGPAKYTKSKEKR